MKIMKILIFGSMLNNQMLSRLDSILKRFYTKLSIETEDLKIWRFEDLKIWRFEESLKQKKKIKLKPDLLFDRTSKSLRYIHKSPQPSLNLSTCSMSYCLMNALCESFMTTLWQCCHISILLFLHYIQYLKQ